MASWQFKWEVCSGVLLMSFSAKPPPPPIVSKRPVNAWLYVEGTRGRRGGGGDFQLLYVTTLIFHSMVEASGASYHFSIPSCEVFDTDGQPGGSVGEKKLRLCINLAE